MILFGDAALRKYIDAMKVRFDLPLFDVGERPIVEEASFLSFDAYVPELGREQAFIVRIDRPRVGTISATDILHGDAVAPRAGLASRGTTLRNCHHLLTVDTEDALSLHCSAAMLAAHHRNPLIRSPEQEERFGEEMSYLNRHGFYGDEVSFAAYVDLGDGKSKLTLFPVTDGLSVFAADDVVPFSVVRP
jgi:hypothetical protein